VPSERQLAANRRNARKSTGPKTRAGRKRASRNSYRHGLSVSITSSSAFAEQLEKLALKIAGDSEDVIILERARAIAQAELELQRVRRAKTAVVASAMACGRFDPPPPVNSIRLLIPFQDGGSMPKPMDHAAAMPAQEPDRSAEAIRRAIPELLKLDRYERRSVVMRDRAVFDFIKRRAHLAGAPLRK
jgi:hypothetical protein